MPGVEMEDNAKGHEEDHAGKRGQSDQREVDVAVQMLAGTAVGAAVKVFVVVFPHLGREAGDVITPAGKNFSNNGIDALAHRGYNIGTTAGSPPSAPIVAPASPGSGATSGVVPGPFPLCPARARDGC